MASTSSSASSSSATQVTVSIKKASEGLSDISKAVEQQLAIEQSLVSKGLKKELTLETQVEQTEYQLNLSGNQLHGPQVGIRIPTTSQLLAVLVPVLDIYYPVGTGVTNSDPNQQVRDAINLELLTPDFNTLLNAYSNSANAVLEASEINYIQQKISSIVTGDITVSNVINKAGTLSASYKRQRVTSNILNEVVTQYLDKLNGPDSTVFPKPGGVTFLTNLENALVNSITSQFADTYGTGTEDYWEKYGYLNFVRTGVQEVLFTQLGDEFGYQGAVLSDGYDFETSISLQQNTTSILDSLAGFDAALSTANKLAISAGQTVLKAKQAAINFLDAWEAAENSLDSNEGLVGSGSHTISSIKNNLYTQANKEYIESLITTSDSGENVQLLEDAESYSAQLSGEVAGLNFMGTTTLNKNPGANQVAALSNSISQNFGKDNKSLATAYSNYSTDMASYLKNYQDLELEESEVNAQNSVVGDINTLQGSYSSPNLDPQFDDTP